MSDQNRPSEQSSLPPASHEHSQGYSMLGMSVPTLLTLGTGLAAMWLLENQTQVLSRTASQARDKAEDWWHDAEDWYEDAAPRTRRWARDASESASETAGAWGGRLSDNLISAGAKAAGIAGVLKTLGGGAMSTGTSRAAKLLALKKVAEYATQTARQLGESAARNPRVTAMTAAGAARARSLGHEGSERLRGAYGALRGRPVRRRDEREWGTAEVAMVGLALVGAGVAATYLLSPSQGAQRRRELRLRTQALSRQAGDWAQDLGGTAREWAESAAHGVTSRLGHGGQTGGTGGDERRGTETRRQSGSASQGSRTKGREGASNDAGGTPAGDA